MSNHAKELRQLKAAQRHYDNVMPDEQDEPQRVCKCCGEWVSESGFRTPQSHNCNNCLADIRDIELMR